MRLRLVIPFGKNSIEKVDFNDEKKLIEYGVFLSKQHEDTPFEFLAGKPGRAKNVLVNPCRVKWIPHRIGAGAEQRLYTGWLIAVQKLKFGVADYHTRFLSIKHYPVPATCWGTIQVHQSSTEEVQELYYEAGIHPRQLCLF